MFSNVKIVKDDMYNRRQKNYTVKIKCAILNVAHFL